MIDGAIDIVLLLAILVGLVVIHELGHFVAARRAGVRVHEFGVGFPPRAGILHRGKETLWTLNWLPIGGFVRLEGEEGESLDSRAFVNQPLRTRLVILLAGVGMNFLLAWAIMSLIAGLADPVSTVRVAQVMPGTPAARIGLVGSGTGGTEGTAAPTAGGGDTIVGIDGHTWMVFDDITNADAVLSYLRAHAGQEVTISIRRADGSLVDKTVQLRPAKTPVFVAGGTVVLVPTSALGIVIDRTSYESSTRGPIDAIVTGFHRTVDASTLVIRGLGDLISNIGDPQVSGPIGMVGLVGTTRELPPAFLIWLIALLSANLAVINILPFPPMDGGRMAMAIAQRLSGGRISVNLERAIYFSGFVALMGLLVWISIFDVRRLAGG